MISKEIVINNESGLESKAAALLIQKASAFESNIWIQKGERKANAKSLLGILSLSVGRGEKVLLIADGNDEKIALQELDLFAGKAVLDQ